MSSSFGYLSIAALLAAVPAVTGCGGGQDSATKSAGTSTGKRPAVQSASYTTPKPPAETDSEKTGNPVQVSYADAEAAFRAGQYNDATTLFTTYTGHHPENAWGYYMLGLSTWKAGNLAHASEAFDQALKLDPRHRKSLLNSARVFFERDRAADALERIEQALVLEPMSAEAIRLRGRAFHELGRTDEAIEAYRRALSLDDRDVWAMNNLGLIYIQLGRYRDALPPLARAIELRSNSPVFQSNLGVALERSGRSADSKVAYEKAVRADSTYENAKRGLARVAGAADDTASQPIDLPTLAQEFVTMVKQWQDSASTIGVEAGDTTDVMVRDTLDPLEP